MSASQLSVQLWSIRSALAEDPRAALERLAEIGFTQVEPYRFGVDPAVDPALIRAMGLEVRFAHSRFLSLNADLDAVFAKAAEVGYETLIEPLFDDGVERFSTADGVRRTADEINAAAAVAQKHGVRVGYHNHWWEVDGEIDGGSPLEYLAANLDPEVVLEVDTYWVTVGGRSAAAVLEVLGERVKAVHMKDGDPGHANKPNPGVGEWVVGRQLPFGSGAVAHRDVLAAIPADAVRVVEFDDYDGDVYAGIKRAYDFLINAEVKS